MSDPAFELELLDVAREAARASADELMPRFGHRQAEVRSKSTPTDLVSEADLAGEEAIRRVLAARRPGDAVLGEEGGSTAGDGDLRWVVDPLDGTINYLYEIPMFAVSVACEDADGVVAGVVLDPCRDECFTATRSGQAELNGVVLHASEQSDLSMLLVATGFGYDPRIRARQAEAIPRVLPRVANIRRGGAAAQDLAWCASGRYDAFYERGLKAWDLAAGALIAARAGLEVRELPERGEDEPWGVLAAPAAVVDELLALVLGD